MRIAVLGSVALPVPPPAQGGTEWIAFYQAEGLGKKGHEVLLFAAQGSRESNYYRLVIAGGGDTVEGSSLNLQKEGVFETSRKMRTEAVYLARVMDELDRHKDSYDLILNNMRGEAVLVPFSEKLGKPIVCVMHLPIFPQLAQFFQDHKVGVITLSNAQRQGYPKLNYLANIGNCVDSQKYTFNPNPAGDYYLMMGSIAPHKNQLDAILAVKKLGDKLIMAGKIGNSGYYEEKIREHIDGESIIWLGELDFQEKLRLYQNARALVFPVIWPEPFGLVMIEAMACGTPVVAYPSGSVGEVVIPGVTGYITNRQDVELLVSSLKEVGGLNRLEISEYARENFSIEKMVSSYERALINLPFIQ